MLHILYFSSQIPLAVFVLIFFYAYASFSLELNKKDFNDQNDFIVFYFFYNCLTKTHVYLHVLFRMLSGQLTLFISRAALFVLKV